MCREFDLNARYTYVYGGGEIDDVGREKILEILRENAPSLILPNNWQWTTHVGGRGEYVGAFSKRVAKFFHQNGIKLSSDTLGKIGSIVGLHTTSPTTYYFDFTDAFSWRDGAFGDSDSCYWGCRCAAREVLQNNGCLAMRFYDGENRDNGEARAWIYPYNGGWIVFNGYGYETLKIAQILSSFLGCTYRRISLVNKNSATNLIWINNAKGYYIGREGCVVHNEKIDLHIVEADDYIACDDCKNWVNNDDIIECEGKYVCESCLDENYTVCDDCGECVNNDDITECEGKYVCESCRDENYTVCDYCGDWVNNDDITECEGKYVCESCRDENYTVCDDCKNWVNNDDIINCDGEYLCEHCRDKNYTVCDDCGEWVRKGNIIKCEEKYLCEDCASEKEGVAA